VVGPDHQDAACKVDQPRRRSWPKAPEEPFRQPEKWSDANYANRRDDVRLVLDQMLADPEFGRQIDPNRIGVCGHSLGGYTALGVSGAWSSWEDRRIRAALLFSPYVTPFLSQHTLKQVDIPVMYQGGTLDFGVTPFLRREGGAYDSSSPPKFYVELAATGHLDWSVKVCDGQDSVEQCATSVRKARLINQYGIGFFDHFLKQVPELGFPARTVPGVVDYRQAR
jgi:predicted dienelactone hydrolase